MKTKYLITAMLTLLIVSSMNSQTEFKIDSTHVFSWDNSSNDWKHNTRETLAYDNGGTKETHLLRLILSGVNWVNFYQFNKSYDVNNNLIQNIQQNWNGSAWDNSAKYDYGYDGNNNETSYLYSFFTSGNWQGYQRTLQSYDGNKLDVKTMEEYDFVTMVFVPEEQFLYTYNGDLLDYEISQIYFSDVTAWENDEKIDYIYNASNQVTDIDFFGFNSTTGEFSDSPYKKIANSYTSEGLIEEIVTQIWATSEFVNTERFAYTYLDGNQTELLIQNWNSSTMDWVNTARQIRDFDANDNEVELIYETWDTSVTPNAWKGISRSLNFWSTAETLEISEINKTMITTVYPNPATELIYINSNELINEVEIYNLRGKQVLKSGKVSSLNVSNLQAGIYLVKIISEDKTITKKIIKK